MPESKKSVRLQVWNLSLSISQLCHCDLQTGWTLRKSGKKCDVINDIVYESVMLEGTVEIIIYIKYVTNIL